MAFTVGIKLTFCCGTFGVHFGWDDHAYYINYFIVRVYMLQGKMVNRLFFC